MLLYILTLPVCGLWICCRYYFTDFVWNYRNSTEATIKTITVGNDGLITLFWHSVFGFRFNLINRCFSEAVVTLLFRIFLFAPP